MDLQLQLDGSGLSTLDTLTSNAYEMIRLTTAIGLQKLADSLPESAASSTRESITTNLHLSLSAADTVAKEQAEQIQDLQVSNAEKEVLASKVAALEEEAIRLERTKEECASEALNLAHEFRLAKLKGAERAEKTRGLHALEKEALISQNAKLMEDIEHQSQLREGSMRANTNLRQYLKTAIMKGTAQAEIIASLEVRIDHLSTSRDRAFTKARDFKVSHEQEQADRASDHQKWTAEKEVLEAEILELNNNVACQLRIKRAALMKATDLQQELARATSNAVAETEKLARLDSTISNLRIERTSLKLEFKNLKQINVLLEKEVETRGSAEHMWKMEAKALRTKVEQLKNKGEQ